MNHRVTLQKRATVRDVYGQEANTWNDIATVWANIKPIGGREKLRSFVVDSTLTHTVMIRYRQAFLPPLNVNEWRLNYQGRIFNIIAARDVDEAHFFIILDCSEGSADGQ